MNVEALYIKTGGDYAGAIHLFQTDERIMKYLKIMQNDTNLDVVCKALPQNDYETAFCAAHTIKGLALNMHLTALANKAGTLTELLRSRQAHEDILPLLAEVKQTYQTLMDCMENGLKSTTERSLECETAK